MATPFAIFVFLLLDVNGERTCPSLEINVIPDPYFCRGYFHCEHGIPSSRRCANGEVFNKDTKACQKGDCKDKSTFGSNCVVGQTVVPTPDEFECRSFHICNTNINLVHNWTCPDGSFFNSNNHRCVTGNCRDSPVAPIPSCPKADGFIFMAIPGDCFRFILCRNSIAEIMRCPFGTVFDLDKSFCDWPKNTGRDCEDMFAPPYPTGQTRSHTPATQPPQDLKSFMPIVHPSTLLLLPIMIHSDFRFAVLIFCLTDVLGELCSDVDPSELNYLLEIRDDCYHFIKCSNRKAYVMRCPDGTVFNKNVCDWPWNAQRECGPEPTERPMNVSTTPSPWTPSSRPPTPTSRSPTPSSRTPTPTSRTPTPTSRTPTPSSPTPTSRTPTPSSPTPTSRTPTPTSRTPTPTRPMPRNCSEVDPSDPNYLIEIPDDCYHFIMCSNRKAYVMRCPDGTVFNKNVCDWPWNAHRECGPEPTSGRPIAAPTTPSPWTPTSRTPTPTSRTPTPTSRSPTPTSRTPTPTRPMPRNCSEVDPSDPNYLIEIPDDCYHFIMCSNRRPVIMACPVGTVFNPYNSICVWPWNAHRDCGPTPSPTGTPTSPRTRTPATPTSKTPTASPRTQTPTTWGSSSPWTWASTTQTATAPWAWTTIEP